MSKGARKVVLTAFGNRLVSKPMEWPIEEIGHDIYLMLDMEQPSVSFEPMSSIKTYETTTKRGRFEFTGGYSGNGDMPAIYVLVGID